ncbi:MAG: hypothetical protein AAF676_09840 [Pseudomonadota bacterium]
MQPPLARSLLADRLKQMAIGQHDARPRGQGGSLGRSAESDLADRAVELFDLVAMQHRRLLPAAEFGPVQRSASVDQGDGRTAAAENLHGFKYKRLGR